jgi:transposase
VSAQAAASWSTASQYNNKRLDTRTPGLVVTREGLPLGYELFAGNKHDPLSLEGIVNTMEERYGKANRVWAMDRGFFSEKNMAFLRQTDRRYIIGTPKSMLKQFRHELTSGHWNQVHAGLEVRLCPSSDSNEKFILCRRQQRKEKEKAMHDRFEKWIEDGLKKMATSCSKRRIRSDVLERRVGKLLGSSANGQDWAVNHVPYFRNSSKYGWWKSLCRPAPGWP